ncbi:MAG: TetR/AcrR family transcriptional regulator [Betaproteobacteria bacterium]|nr:TetR/AcrR family transcriptional regulator [Betaproteobacteria bacterium]
MNTVLKEKQTAILAAAERLFAERGYAATRTADVARAAQVTERTLFKYFPDKETLLNRVVLPAMSAAAAAPQTGDAPFGDWFAAFLRGRLAEAQARPHALRVVLIALLTSEAARQRFGPLWKRQLWSALVKAIVRFQARGELRRDLDAESLTRMLLSLSLGYLLTRTLVAPALAWNDEREIERLLEVLQRGAATSGFVAG